MPQALTFYEVYKGNDLLKLYLVNRLLFVTAMSESNEVVGNEYYVISLLEIIGRGK